MNLILLALLFFGSNSHDIQVAFYKISQDKSNLVVEFVFEDKDISNEFTNLTAEALQGYIADNFSLSVDGNDAVLLFRNFKIEGNHVYLVADIPLKRQIVRTMILTNTCLINIDDHSNIVEITLNQKQRDFLMNRERTSIHINY